MREAAAQSAVCLGPLRERLVGLLSRRGWLRYGGLQGASSCLLVLWPGICSTIVSFRYHFILGVSRFLTVCETDSILFSAKSQERGKLAILKPRLLAHSSLASSFPLRILLSDVPLSPSIRKLYSFSFLDFPKLFLPEALSELLFLFSANSEIRLTAHPALLLPLSATALLILKKHDLPVFSYWFAIKAKFIGADSK